MAADNIGTAYVQIVPAATGITNKMTTAINPAAQAAGVAAGKKISGGISSQLKSVGGGMMKAGGIMTGIGAAATAIGSKFVASARSTEESQTKLREVMRAMMNATQGEVDAVNDLISAEAQSGVVGKGAQRNGAQQMATYIHSTEALKTLIPAMNDLAVQQYGTSASADQLVGISNMMGKVFTGQVGALRRAGISFDENSEKILKNGTEQEKAAELAKVVAQNVGDMNQEFAKTDSGKITKAQQAISSVGNQIGSMLLPVVGDVALFISKKIMPNVQKVIDLLGKNPILAKIAVAVTGILSIGGPLLVLLGTIVSSVGALMPVLAGISAPIVGIVAAIAGVIAILIYAWKTNDQFRAAVINLVTQVSGAVKKLVAAVMPTIKGIIKIILQLVSSIASSLVPVIKTMTPIITKAVNLVAAVFQKVGPIVLKILGSIAKTVASVIGTAVKIFTGFVSTVSKVWSKVTSVIGSAVNWIKSHLSFSAVVNKVKSTFGKVVDFIGGPFKKAKELVDKAVGAIKRIFSLKLGKIFSGIKLPHFKISGGKIPWGIGGKGVKPSVSVDWYAKGGIFNNASVIGIGEAGREAAVPLQGRYMRPFAQAIANEMAGAGNTYNIGDVSLSVEDLKDIVTLEQFVTIIKRAKGLTGARA